MTNQTSVEFFNVEFTVPEFFLTAIFSDDVSSLNQEEANQVLAFLYGSTNDLKKQEVNFSHWAVENQEQEPSFKKFHDGNFYGVQACNCVDIVAVCKK